jgi:hypothetical protein
MGPLCRPFRGRSNALVPFLVLAAGLAVVATPACEPNVTGGSSGTGGAPSGTGGTKATGGVTGTGTAGAPGTGGSVTGNTGGQVGTGGAPGTGGSVGTGGAAPGTGGTAPGTGGKSGTGGAPGTGGVAPGTGGSVATGGTVGTGGAAGSSGSTGPIDLTGRKALLVVDSPSSLADGEVILQETLEERGLTVTVGASTGPASLASGQNVVIVSDSSSASDFTPIFGSVPVPMIVFGNSAFQQLGWTNSSSAKGTVNSTTMVSIVSTSTTLSSDLAAGTAFTMILPTQSTSLYWGTPGGAPITVASIMGSANELIDFAYEKGTATATGTAPARRVGLGWKTNAIQNLTINGFKLLSAAIDWTAGSN